MPEISYSTSTGFTVTNFSTLLNDTGTGSSDWEAGLLYYHKSISRKSDTRENHIRHFRTTWNKYHANEDGMAFNKSRGTLLSINNSGVVSNTNSLSKTISSTDNRASQAYPIIGIRLRYKVKPRAENRSRYSKTMYEFRSSSNIVAVTTSNYIK